MVFLIDDAFEFATADIIIAIGTEVIELITGSAVTAGATVAETFNTLLGQSGVQVVLDMVKIGGGEAVASNVVSVDELGGMVLKTIEDEGILLWEAQPEISKAVPENVFINKFKELAASLVKQGVNLKDLSGKQLLRTIAGKALELGKNGIKKAIAPTAIGGGIIGALGANKIYQKFKRKADREFKLRKTRRIENEPIEEVQRF